MPFKKRIWTDLIKDKFIKLLGFLFDNIDIALTFALAIYAAIKAVYGGPLQYVIPTFSAVLVVLSVSILKERHNREKLNNLLEKLLRNITADTFFTNKTDERAYILKAKKEILLIQETGLKISETCRKELLNFIQSSSDSKIRIITALNKTPIIELLAYRNANLTKEVMSSRLKSGIDMIKVLSDAAEDASNRIEVRFLPYPPDITAIFIDPNHSNPRKSEALIRLQGFKVTFDDKLDFELNRYDAEEVYSLYKKQFDNMWKQSIKCILITGRPGIGKSTILSNVVNELSKKSKTNNVAGFITHADVDANGNRIGFVTKTINNQHSGSFAVKGADQYILNEKTMTDIIIPTLEAGIKTSNLLIIDEIGPLQFQNARFRELIDLALNTPTLSILGSVSLIETHKDVTGIHNHYRTGIIEVNINNRTKTETHLIEEFRNHFSPLKF
jgi:nucleoside-triphosphatase THEP1